ncbi:MAG: Iron complex outerrane recepter protein [Verrucomicrobia bacterium]|nr:Iron complex outerrane recepter protein [Verrucomicrobiota bacterium]
MNPEATSFARNRRTLCALCFLLPAAVVTAQEPEQTPAKDEPTPDIVKVSNDEVVKLEAFKVTTDIGSYHQTTSSMASKIPMDLKELSSSLSIMNATAITDRNAVTLTDVFNYVVGATQSQGNINGFSFRGFPNTGSYTQNIQFDGLMGATLKKAATSAANVESLEFLKGPNGVLYGQMNPGGLLNIVTKAPKERQQTYIRTTFGTFAGEFTGPGKKNNETVSFDTTGPVGSSKHLFYRLIVDAASSPSSRPKNWAQALSYYPSMTYKWSPETYLTVKGEVSQDFRRQDDGVLPIFTNNTAFGETATYYTAPLNTVYNDSKDKATDRGSALSTYFHAALGKDWTLRIQTRTVWHLDVVRELTINNANIYSPASTFAKPTSLLRRQYNYVKNGHRYNFGDANIFRIFETGKVKQTVLLGVGGGGEFFGNQRIAFGPNQLVTQAITLTHPTIDLYDYPADGTGATNQITYQTAFGEYISDQITLGERLHVSLGYRHDNQKVHGQNVLAPALTTFATELKANTKQAGVVVDITKTLSAYGSYSQSIKPQVNIAYDASGNSTFPPETGEQYEAGLKFDTVDKNLNATFAAYEINRTNVIVASGTNFTVPTGSAQVGQAISRLDGGQRSRGLEFETQWQPIPNWQLQAGIAYSKAIIVASAKNPTTVGLDLANAPRVSGNFWTRYNLPKGKFEGLGFGTGVIYVGKAWAGDPTTTVYYRLKSWTRVDSSVYYRWKRYDLALNIQNLFDRRYIGSAQSALTLNIGEQRKLTLSLGAHF